ncbi:hypothetical protein RclHR1_00080016 [Rhizophagus clarus]|uniref:Uncharacterized protein n=1 Tax=Rhizophagus clarus TaxID=94130 RepID=A0A2Z6SMM9_9GLOM|nr:hypothetical protein RclHR1_00080016 [Rhizophagus clarus]GET04060.1 hypothetical protein RCL_jg24390.t1 [Rhizophagus clarus]
MSGKTFIGPNSPIRFKESLQFDLINRIDYIREIQESDEHCNGKLLEIQENSDNISQNNIEDRDNCENLYVQTNTDDRHNSSAQTIIKDCIDLDVQANTEKLDNSVIQITTENRDITVIQKQQKKL